MHQVSENDGQSAPEQSLTPDILIVTGPMRSGTTLLGDLLHGGPEVGHRHPQLAFAADTVVDLRRFTDLARERTGTARPLMNAKAPQNFMDAWLACAADPSEWGTFVRNIAVIAPTPESPRVIGVKNTCLLPELKALAEQFGRRVKVIVLVRDPRDCVASAIARYEKINSGPATERDSCLALMNASFSLDYMRANFPEEQFRLVRYEALVAQPVETMLSLMSFIDLDPSKYDADAIRDGKVMSNSSYSSVGPDDISRGSGVKPSIGNRGRLSADQLAAVEILFRDMMPAFGYQRGPRPSFSQRLQFYRDTYPKIREYASALGYATDGMNEAAERNAGFDVILALKMRRYWQNAKTKLDLMKKKYRRA